MTKLTDAKSAEEDAHRPQLRDLAFPRALDVLPLEQRQPEPQYLGRGRGCQLSAATHPSVLNSSCDRTYLCARSAETGALCGDDRLAPRPRHLADLGVRREAVHRQHERRLAQDAHAHGPRPAG